METQRGNREKIKMKKMIKSSNGNWLKTINVVIIITSSSNIIPTKNKDNNDEDQQKED